jgi:glycolate oxidase
MILNPGSEYSEGILRGAAGALGGLGVFTKCAIHLHPWAGPKTIELKGISPYYETEVPPNFEYHMMEWPTWAMPTLRWPRPSPNRLLA